MSLHLRLQLPEVISDRYWSHNSDGEHAQKQSGEIGEINELRIERGEGPFDSSQLERFMYNAGVVAVHTMSMWSGGGVGPTIGYVVAERDPRQGTLEVIDLYVKEKHRTQGIGGYLLGKLISDMTPYDTRYRGMARRHYGSVLKIAGRNITLPPSSLEVYTEAFGDKNVLILRKDIVKEGWSGIFSVIGDDQDDIGLYVAGIRVETIISHEPDDYDQPTVFSIGGRPERFFSPVFAAIAALNPDALV